MPEGQRDDAFQDERGLLPIDSGNMSSLIPPSERPLYGPTVRGLRAVAGAGLEQGDVQDVACMRSLSDLSNYQGARVWQSPSRFMQHRGLLPHIGYVVLSTHPDIQRAGVICSKRGSLSEAGKQLISGLKNPVVMLHDEECHRAAVEKLVELCKKEKVDHVISFGGGKVIDVG